MPLQRQTGDSMVGVAVAHGVILGTGALKPLRKGNVDNEQVTLTVVINGNDNRHRLTYSSAGWRVLAMSSHALTSACAIVVAGLPREDKEKLLRELAKECGYLLHPTSHTLEDFQRKLFIDEDE